MQSQERLTCASSAARAPHSMDVVCCAVRKVVADDSVEHKVDALQSSLSGTVKAHRHANGVKFEQDPWAGKSVDRAREATFTRASRSVVTSSQVLPLRNFSIALRRAACP